MSDTLRWTEVADHPGMAFQPMWAGDPDQSPMPEPAASAPEDLFERGLEQGRREAMAGFADERDRYRALIASLEVLRPEPSEELAVLIAETVERLVRTVAGQAPLDRSLLLERAGRAAAIIGEADSSRTLRLNPADLDLIDPADLPLAAIADPSMARGAVRIDCSTSWVEDGIPIYCDVLREQLGVGERP